MSAPLTYEQLIDRIVEQHPGLSARFQEIARFVVQNPNDVALSSLKTLAGRIGVDPSALVRFAQRFEFSGFTDMQRVFQSRLLSAAPGLAERVDGLRRELRGIGRGPSVFRELVLADIAALHELLDIIPDRQFDNAAEILAQARTIYIIGQYRAFPIAHYLRYAMIHFRRDVRLIDGAGGLAAEQARAISADCAMIAVSFRFYAREVVDIVEATDERGVPIVAITDSKLSPLMRHAKEAFLVPAGEHNFANSLAAPVCVARSLVIAMANRLGTDLGDLLPQPPGAAPEVAQIANETTRLSRSDVYAASAKRRARRPSSKPTGKARPSETAATKSSS